MMSGSAAEEVFLPVRVKPRAARAGLLGRHGTGIKVAVRAAPERGKANAELVHVLAEVLAVPSDAIEVVSGAASPDKRLRIRGLDPGELERRLAAALGE